MPDVAQYLLQTQEANLCTPALLAVLWDIDEIFTFCARHGRGIHPGAHVAIELILWLACCGMGGIIVRASFDVGVWLGTVGGYDSTADDFAGLDYGDYSQGDLQAISGYLTKARATGALLYMVA